jgi:hypothetical protein
MEGVFDEVILWLHLTVMYDVFHFEKKNTA